MDPSRGGIEFYRRADEILSEGVGSDIGVSFLCRAGPGHLSEEQRLGCHERLSALREFYDISLSIFKRALKGEMPACVYDFLMNDTPIGLRRTYHLKLPDALYFPPTFFRTDETPSGKIMEIQCPGSGWGDLQFFRDVYREYMGDDFVREYEPSTLFANEVVAVVKKDNPTVLHLLDNASAPSSMKYLIRTSHPPLRYWGFHPDVRQGKCDFVRSHSFFGLVAENLFKLRIVDAARGRVHFDQPPIVLFDQKAPMALPFWTETRSFFPDRVRDSFVYTHPIGPDGFRDEHGEWVTLRELADRPKSKRRYFLKYAGSDVSVNWGGRGVFRLSDKGLKRHLETVIDDYSKRRYWVIQPDMSLTEKVEYFTRDREDSRVSTLYAKYSCFFSIERLLGVKTMHREHPKVHGQANTVVGIVVP